MDFAAKFGLNVAETASNLEHQFPYLISRRFDRHIDENLTIRRLHQEDFAQALGLLDTEKYEYRCERETCYSAKAIKELLDKTRNPALAKQEFIRLSMFNLFVGNTDNHAKNHALIYLPGHSKPTFAPAYDLQPTMADRNSHNYLSFNIGHATHWKT